MFYTKKISFSVKISVPTEATIIPVGQSFVNTFDLIGDIVSLKRNDLEKNIDYKKRLMDVSVHPGAPVYVGIINNITRDLGLSRAKAVTISLKQSSSGDVVARNPRVDFLSNRVVLYHDWRPDGTEEIDREIRFYQPTDDGYFISNFVSLINESQYFSATLEDGIRPNLHTSTLIRRGSDLIVYNDYIKPTNRTVLNNKNLVEGSIVFSESDYVFVTEVEGTPSAQGEYSINRTDAIIESYTIPSGNGSVSYHYGLFPLELSYSEAMVFSLQDDNFLDELFVQEELPSGEYADALPNTEGSEILHQLYKDMTMFWGD